MTQRLTQEQLKQIIAEVGQLQQRRDEEIDPEQVKQILQELNLPPELLDEAITQLYRREALKAQRKRNLSIAKVLIGVGVVAIAVTILFLGQRKSEIASVSAEQDRITLAQDGGNLKSVSRQDNPELFYRVTLKDAPVGEKLNLTCNWSNPNAQVVKENYYQTKDITTSVWDTYCRYNINSTAPTGTWKVEMLLEGRPLSDETFEVK
jgi:hypothetical protein